MLVRPMRPRFELPIAHGVDAACERLRARVAESDCPYQGLHAERHHHFDLRFPPEQRHFWSPCLSVEISEQPEADGSVVNGLIGPHPNVWTMFAFGYLGLFCAIVLGLIFGLVQLSLDQATWALWIVPPALLVALGLYGLSRLGQHFAAEQVIELRHFLEQTLEIDDAERAGTDADPYHARPVK